MRAGGKQGVVALIVVAAATAIAIATAGCGATNTVSGTIDPVARAAEVTRQSAGYRMSGTIRVSGAATTVNGTMAGVIDTRRRRGAMTVRETVFGHSLSIQERLSGTTIYMPAPSQPPVTRVTGGKPWLRLDLRRALGTLGLGGLPTQTTDPSQFLDYLRAVGANTTRIGTETVNGAQTTHYHAVTNLDRYTRLLPPSRRASLARGMANMEAIMGSHTLPMDVWIDSRHLVRRMSFGFSECIQNQHLHFSMTMNMSGYGPQVVPPAPSRNQAYDITPLIMKEMKGVNLTCGA